MADLITEVDVLSNVHGKWQELNTIDPLNQQLGATGRGIVRGFRLEPLSPAGAGFKIVRDATSAAWRRSAG